MTSPLSCVPTIAIQTASSPHLIQEETDRNEAGRGQSTQPVCGSGALRNVTLQIIGTWSAETGCLCGPLKLRGQECPPDLSKASANVSKEGHRGAVEIARGYNTYLM